MRPPDSFIPPTGPAIRYGTTNGREELTEMASAAKQRRIEAPHRGRFAPSGPIAIDASPAPDAGARGTKPRYHAIDALRGMTMFLVIGLHAALGYITRDIPSVLW